jgi:hypothetical protein
MKVLPRHRNGRACVSPYKNKQERTLKIEKLCGKVISSQPNNPHLLFVLIMNRNSAWTQPPSAE